MFSRIIHGNRISLSVGLAAILLSTTAATVIGVVSAYFGGWVDAITRSGSWTHCRLCRV